jgi:hypothetical protein
MGTPNAETSQLASPRQGQGNRTGRDARNARCGSARQLSIRLPVLTVCLLIPLLGESVGNERILTLSDFEQPALPNEWEFARGTPRLTRQGVAHGSQALELAFAEDGGAYITSWRLPRDWSAFDAMVVDVWNPSGQPIRATVLVADQAWREQGSSYWNRHNGNRSLPPGRSQWTIPVGGLFRGEAGSRNNDIRRNIDPDSIIRVDLGFGGEPGGRVVIDHIRMT